MLENGDCMKKYFIFLFIFCLLFFSFPKVTLAEKEASKAIYCPLCEHKSDDDPLYDKERQFYLKINIIKSIFGKSIDEVALAAAVLHRYNNKELAYEREYDEDFSADKWKQMWRDVNSSRSAKVTDDDDNVVFSEEEAKRIEANEQIDLITTAAIVMIDSNQLGTYSDACFKDGLAGDGLVGNTVTSSNSSFIKLVNGLFCGVYKIAELPNPITYIQGLFSGDSLLVTSETSKRRLVNTNLVCENGYVGGLYDSYKIKDETLKKNAKKLYAQQIIDFANYYREHYGNYDGDSVSCNNSGVTGSYSSWKQYDSRWKDIQIGSDSSDTMGNLGCLVTSIAIQISRSGTSLGTFPSGKSEFDPGTLAYSLKENNGFNSGGALIYSGVNVIAPNVKFSGFKTVNISDNKALAEAISKELETGAEDKYQKFIILKIKHRTSNSHWVVVNSVSNDEVTLFDPGASGITLDANYQNWIVEGYNVMYATDVNFGQTGNSSDSSGCGDDYSGLISFLTTVEGNPTCNYRGQGEGTGYASEFLNDGNGYTTALGITHWDEAEAEEVGYTDFKYDLSDSSDHCTNKNYIDQMLPLTIDHMLSGSVDSYAQQIGLTLTDTERMVLVSIVYGGGSYHQRIMDAMKKYGKESNEVFVQFKKSYNPDDPSYRYGLGLRRLAEYEIFMTGNYNAAMLYDYYKSDADIQNATLDEVKSHWPSQRTENLWDGTVSSSNNNSKNLVCKNGKAVSDNSKSENSSLYCGKKNGVTSVLFVGNSRTYMGNIPEKFQGIAEAKGYSVQITKAVEPAQTLLSLSDKFNDTISKPYDCVVVQEQTETYLYDYDTFLSGAKSVIEKARGANSNIVSYVRQTWGLDNSDRSELDTAYSSASKVASETDSNIIADGKAFESCASKYPDIPLFADDRHPTSEGAYLSAATIFKSLYGESPGEIDYSDDIDLNVAKKLLLLVK